VILRTPRYRSAEGRQPGALRRIPNGRGRHPEESVRQQSAARRAIQILVTSAVNLAPLAARVAAIVAERRIRSALDPRFRTLRKDRRRLRAART
jgi:hypothetical protein